MDGAGTFGRVEPTYGTLRRILLPIYATDQLLFAAVFMVAPLAVLAWAKPELALYAGVGGYIGFVSSMVRSTPSSLVMPIGEEQRVAALLDSSPFFERTDDCWNSTKARWRRWDTDNIRIQHFGQTLRLTGRQIDLQQLSKLLRS